MAPVNATHPSSASQPKEGGLEVRSLNFQAMAEGRVPPPGESSLESGDWELPWPLHHHTQFPCRVCNLRDFPVCPAVPKRPATPILIHRRPARVSMLGRGTPKGSREWDNSTIHRQNTGLGNWGARRSAGVLLFEFPVASSQNGSPGWRRPRHPFPKPLPTAMTTSPPHPKAGPVPNTPLTQPLKPVAAAPRSDP
jgi:hypothetical protein